MGNINRIVAVVGATGRLGQQVVDRLAPHFRIRAQGQNAEKLERFRAAGHDCFRCDLRDGEGVTRLFEGADAAIVMIPPGYTADSMADFQSQVASSCYTALERSNCKVILNISAQGMDQRSGTGPIVGLRNFELLLNSLRPGKAVTHLRAAAFMENIFPYTAIMRNSGVWPGGILPDCKHSVVSIADITSCIAAQLESCDQLPEFLNLIGPEDLSPTDMTSILRFELGRPDLRYVFLPDISLRRLYRGFSYTEDAINNVIEMINARNAGLLNGSRDGSEVGSTTFAQALRTFLAPKG